MTFFLVIDLVLRIFPFFSHIFRMFTMLNVVYMTISSQEKHNFHSVHAFTHIRQHYFSKYWGGPMHGRSPPPQLLGGPSPPVPLGLRPCFHCVCLVWRFFVSCLFYCSYFMPNCGACVHVANNDSTSNGERDYFDGRDYSESTDDYLLR